MLVFSVSVRLARSLDYESDPVELLMHITACEKETDPIFCSTTETLTIRLQDVPDIPVFSYFPNPVLLAENSANAVG